MDFGTVSLVLAARGGLPQNILLIAGLSLITIWLMLRLVRRSRRLSLRPSATEQIDLNRQARGMRGDLEDLMVEIEQMAKRLGSQLDAKTLRLEALLREADQKIARLTPPSKAQELKSPSPIDAPAPDPASGADPLAQKVYRLADQGRDAESIARQLDEHVGKVELILALRHA